MMASDVVLPSDPRLGKTVILRGKSSTEHDRISYMIKYRSEGRYAISRQMNCGQFKKFGGQGTLQEVLQRLVGSEFGSNLPELEKLYRVEKALKIVKETQELLKPADSGKRKQGVLEEHDGATELVQGKNKKNKTGPASSSSTPGLADHGLLGPMPAQNGGAAVGGTPPAAGGRVQGGSGGAAASGSEDVANASLNHRTEARGSPNLGSHGAWLARLPPQISRIQAAAAAGSGGGTSEQEWTPDHAEEYDDLYASVSTGDAAASKSSGQREQEIVTHRDADNRLLSGYEARMSTDLEQQGLAEAETAGVTAAATARSSEAAAAAALHHHASGPTATPGGPGPSSRHKEAQEVGEQGRSMPAGRQHPSQQPAPPPSNDTILASVGHLSLGPGDTAQAARVEAGTAAALGLQPGAAGSTGAAVHGGGVFGGSGKEAEVQEQQQHQQQQQRLTQAVDKRRPNECMEKQAAGGHEAPGQNENSKGIYIKQEPSSLGVNENTAGIFIKQEPKTAAAVCGKRFTEAQIAAANAVMQRLCGGLGAASSRGAGAHLSREGQTVGAHAAVGHTAGLAAAGKSGGNLGATSSAAAAAAAPSALRQDAGQQTGPGGQQQQAAQQRHQKAPVEREAFRELPSGLTPEQYRMFSEMLDKNPTIDVPDRFQTEGLKSADLVEVLMHSQDDMSFMLLCTSNGVGKTAPCLMQFENLRRLSSELYPSLLLASVKQEVGGVKKGDVVVLKLSKHYEQASEVPTVWPDVLNPLKPDWRGAHEAQYCNNLAPAHALAMLAVRLKDTDVVGPLKAAAADQGKAPQQRIVMVSAVVLPKAVCSLHDILERLQGQGVDPFGVLMVGFDLLSGAAYLNKLGIIHRDIKPENVLLVLLSELFAFLPTQLTLSQLLLPVSVAQLTDPGVAYLPERANTKPPNTYCGTEGYMAPEVTVKARVSDAKPYSCAVDAYSIGIVMAAMLSGRPAGTWRLLGGTKELLRVAVIRVNKAFTGELQVTGNRVIEFLTAALTEDPAKRPTAAQLLETPLMQGMRSWRAGLLADPTRVIDSFVISCSGRDPDKKRFYEAQRRQLPPFISRT